VSLELDIHALRSEGFSFSQIGERLGLTKDQAQKRYQKFLLSSPLPHTPSPVSTSSEGGLVKKDLTPLPPQPMRSISHLLMLCIWITFRESESEGNQRMNW
jgi:hypothetical protein